MTVIATDSNRLSTVVKNEYAISLGYCREAVTVNDAALTYKVGQVLGATLTGGAGAATAGAGNTGTGTVGTITVSGTAQVGTYTVRFVKAVANAGDFYVAGPSGRVVGTGSVGVVFTGGGLSFTISDATDFVVGDTFTIAVTGTVKYKVLTTTATDGSATAAGIFISDKTGNSFDTAIAATTDTTVVILARGPAIVSKLALVLDTSVSTTAQKNQVYADLKALGILAETTI